MNQEKDKLIEQQFKDREDFEYDIREKVLARTAHLDLLYRRRRNVIISLVAPLLYCGYKRKFAFPKFLLQSFLTFSVINYWNETTHDNIGRELNMRISEQINTMMDLE